MTPTLKAANFMTSAIMKPFSKSVWILPAACNHIILSISLGMLKVIYYIPVEQCCLFGSSKLSPDITIEQLQFLIN